MNGKPGMFNGKGARHNSACKYHGLDRYAFWYFVWMHKRVRRKARLTTAFPRTRQGYMDFCKELGPIPRDMRRPSVGRRDHTYGYIHGNIFWEEYQTNVRKGERVNQAMQVSEDPPF